MKLRPIQLVCLALLLATLRLADPGAPAPGQLVLQARYLNVLLGQTNTHAIEATGQRQSARRAPAPRSVTTTLAAAALAALETPWTMRPPSAHQAALQSVTGFGRRSAWLALPSPLPYCL